MAETLDTLPGHALVEQVELTPARHEMAVRALATLPGLQAAVEKASTSNTEAAFGSQ